MNRLPAPFLILGLYIALLAARPLGAQNTEQGRNSRVLSISYSPLIIGKISLEEAYHPLDTLALHDVDPGGVSSQVNLAYTQKTGPWFAWGLKLSYSYTSGTYLPQNKGFRNMRTDNDGNRFYFERYASMQQKISDLSIFAEFDMIARNPDDALLFGIGLGGALMHRRDLYLERSTSTGLIYNGLERIRYGRVFRAWLSLEWEEFLGKNWGYRLSAGAYLPFWFKPARIQYATDIREAQDFGESSLSRDTQYNGKAYQERFQLIGLFAGVSVLYRF